MENKLTINGITYVKAGSNKNHSYKINLKAHPNVEVTGECRQLEINNYIDKWKLLAMVIEKDNNFFMPAIEYYRNDKLLESMDGESWLLAVANRHYESMGELDDYADEIRDSIIYLCDYMKNNKWI